MAHTLGTPSELFRKLDDLGLDWLESLEAALGFGLAANSAQSPSADTGIIDELQLFVGAARADGEVSRVIATTMSWPDFFLAAGLPEDFSPESPDSVGESGIDESAFDAILEHAAVLSTQASGESTVQLEAAASQPVFGARELTVALLRYPGSLLVKALDKVGASATQLGDAVAEYDDPLSIYHNPAARGDESLDLDDYSETVHTALSYAARLADQIASKSEPKRTGWIDSRLVLAGLLLYAADSARPDVPNWLWAHVAEPDANPLEVTDLTEMFGFLVVPTALGNLPSVTDFDSDGRALLTSAAALKEEVSIEPGIKARHLVAALLAPESELAGSRVLRAVSIDVDTLRRDLLNWMRANGWKNETDRPDEWRAALMRRAAPGALTIAGYRTDAVADDVDESADYLDIGREVRALCSVIAAADVTPPLAIGLFGDWGTGKTFFMKKPSWKVGHAGFPRVQPRMTCRTWARRQHRAIRRRGVC